MSKIKLTPWFPGGVKPVWPGVYRAQDKTMRCNCCWIELEWRGGEWFCRAYSTDSFRNHFWSHNVRRWRGLAEKP